MYSVPLQLSRVKLGQSASLPQLEGQTASPYEAKFADGVEEAVIVAISPLGWYLVAPAGGGPLRWAKPVAEGGGKAWGFRTEEGYGYFDRVLIWVDDEGDQVVILGVIPEESAPDEELAVAHSQGSGVALTQLDVLKELDPREKSPVWVRGSKAVDWLPGIDRSLQTPFGGGWHVDLFWSYFRALEGVGISFFALQGLAHLASKQLRIHSDVHEESYLVNEKIGIREYGVTPYRKEAQGFRFDQEPTITETDNFLVNKTSLAARDVDWDRLPLYRFQQLSGFTGEVRATQTPPEEGKLGKGQFGETLFVDHVGVDGSWYLASRTGFFLHKTPYLPNWSRRQHLHDKNVEIPTEQLWEAIDGWDQEYAGVLGLEDVLARRVYELAEPLNKTVYDIKQPSQSSNQQIPIYSELKSNEVLSINPRSVSLYDLRQDKLQTYDTQAGVFALPDGDLVIRGGGGAEIVLSRGNIFIHAPGSVVLSSGRKIGLLAGDDLIGLAGKSLEMFALENDLRLFANKNLELTSAVSGRGRLLLENKAKHQQKWKHEKTGEDIDSEGIFLKTDSRICLYGEKIGLNASEIVSSSVYWRLLTEIIYREYVVSTDSIADEAILSVTPYEFLYSGMMTADKGLNIPEGGLNVKDYIAVLDGHIATAQGGDVGKLAASSRYKLSSSFRQLVDQIGRAKTTYQESRNEYEKEWKEEEKPFNDQFIEYLMFAPRNDKQNDEDKFKQPKPYWVRFATKSGQSVDKVQIEPIPYHDGRVYFPWPKMGYHVDGLWKLAAADSIQDFSDSYKQLQLQTLLESWELYRV